MQRLPFMTFATNVPTLVGQLQSNAAATADALGERVLGRVAKVERYSATGNTTTKITLPAKSGRTAYAVLLVRAHMTSDPGTDIAVTGRLNFAQPDGDTLAVFEPGGLTLNTNYDLTFLVLESQGV